jgi:hypothetical protein
LQACDGDVHAHHRKCQYAKLSDLFFFSPAAAQGAVVAVCCVSRLEGSRKLGDSAPENRREVGRL